MTKFGCLKTDWCVFLYLANKEVENIDFPLGEKWFTKFVGIKIEFYVLYLTLKKKSFYVVVLGFCYSWSNELMGLFGSFFRYSLQLLFIYPLVPPLFIYR